MKTSVLIILTVTVLVVGTLATMNEACKSQPTCVVRSYVQRTAPHKNCQLRSGN